MTNEQLTEAIATLTEEVALLKNQMRGVREENMVMLEDRQIQPIKVKTEFRLGERCYYTEKTDGNFYTQGERA